MDINQFGGSQACSNLTILPTESNLQILHVRLVDKLFHNGNSLFRIDPKVELLRGMADHLVALPTSLDLECLVNINIVIRRSH